MGSVYLCEHQYMKRLVAVKVLPFDKIQGDATAEERFYREAQAVAALDHPNIVRAYDIDKYENVHFFVMEFVDGASLQEVVYRTLKKNVKFDTTRAAQYIAQAAAGLQHASDYGILHRDIKPGNLLLDRNGIIKILDMGLARFFDHRHDGLTQRIDDNCILGTADYLAPEQAMNGKVDIRADIYGLGGTLYFLLTGQSPFPDGTVAQKLVAHQTQHPKPVESFRQDVPAELLAVLAKMMAKNPDERYQSPAEVIIALEPWIQQPSVKPELYEMPATSPAVQKLMGQNPIPGSFYSERLLADALGDSYHGTAPRTGRSQAMVPTMRGNDTMPMSPARVGKSGSSLNRSSVVLLDHELSRLRNTPASQRSAKNRQRGIPFRWFMIGLLLTAIVTASLTLLLLWLIRGN
jgi:serine/threonine protein kinase